MPATPEGGAMASSRRPLIRGSLALLSIILFLTPSRGAARPQLPGPNTDGVSGETRLLAMRYGLD